MRKIDFDFGTLLFGFVALAFLILTYWIGR